MRACSKEPYAKRLDSLFTSRSRTNSLGRPGRGRPGRAPREELSASILQDGTKLTTPRLQRGTIGMMRRRRVHVEHVVAEPPGVHMEVQMRHFLVRGAAC